MGDVRIVARNLRSQFVGYKRKYEARKIIKSGQSGDQILNKNQDRPKWKFYDKIEEIFHSFNAAEDRRGTETINVPEIGANLEINLNNI